MRFIVSLRKSTVAAAQLGIKLVDPVRHALEVKPAEEALKPRCVVIIGARLIFGYGRPVWASLPLLNTASSSSVSSGRMRLMPPAWAEAQTMRVAGFCGACPPGGSPRRQARCVRAGQRRSRRRRQGSAAERRDVGGLFKQQIQIHTSRQLTKSNSSSYIETVSPSLMPRSLKASIMPLEVSTLWKYWSDS